MDLVFFILLMLRGQINKKLYFLFFYFFHSEGESDEILTKILHTKKGNKNEENLKI